MFTHYREKLHLKKIAIGMPSRSYLPIDWSKKKLPAVAVLADANIFEDANFQRFIDKLNRQFQKVHVLGFLNQKEPISPQEFPIFTKKEVDWLWRPKGKQFRNFLNKKYDLLINLSQEKYLPLEYLAASCTANYKIGAIMDYPNQYDLILRMEDFQSYIHQTNFFLSKFKKDSQLTSHSLGVWGQKI